MPGGATPPSARAARGRPGGFGRPSSPSAERVSDFLRRGHGPELRRRRAVAGLSLFSIGCFAAVELYQMGIVPKLPEPPGRWFATAEVDASGEAYWALNTPDAALGIAQYAGTLALAGLGGEDRARERPWVPLVLAAKVLADAAGAAGLTAEQVSRHRALCFYCLLAAGATWASVPLVLPEARDAWRALAGRG